MNYLKASYDISEYIEVVETQIGVDHVLGSRGILILISLIIVIMIIDTSVVKISAFVGGLASPASTVIIFTVMALIFSVGQYLILSFVRTRNSDASTQFGSKLLSRIYGLVAIVQHALIIILSALILQMVLTSSYNTFFLQVVIWINYVLAVGLLGFLSQRFLLWYKSNHDGVVLAYSIAMIMICTSALFALVYVTNQFTHSFSGPIVRPALTPVANFQSAYDIFNAGYVLTSVIAFVLTWIATVLLLRSYSRKLGIAKYWILVSIPLVYFLSQFQFLFVDVFTSFRISDPIQFGIVFTLFFNATIPIGGALFGIAFWSVAKNINRYIVKQYMMVSAYGMMLLFSSNQASGLTLVPYPPFGLITVSFFGLASFLVFVGIYSSAISVAQDSKLRKSIRGFAIGETRLLDSIGTAQMEREIENRVLGLTKKSQSRMAKETGIESSLSEDDIKQYLEQVMQEVQNQRAQPNND
jgi:hypothetical protein